MWLERRLDAWPAPRTAAVDPRARDLLRRHLRRGRRRAAGALERDLVPGCAARALRRRRARGRLAPPPRDRQRRSSRRRSTMPAPTLGDVDAVAVTRRPGLIGALLVGLSTAKGTGGRRRAGRWSASTTSTATSRRTSSSRTRSSRRSCAWSRAAATPCSPPCARTTASRRSARRSTTPRARRSTRRRGCSASAIRAGPAIERLAARGRPRRVRLPARDDARPRARLQLQRAEDGARLRRRRAAGRRARGAARRPRRVVPGGGRRPARRPSSSARWRAGDWRAVALGGGVAANALLRERVGRDLRAARGRAQARRARAVHRQRGDDRLGRALPRTRALSRSTCRGTRRAMTERARR